MMDAPDGPDRPGASRTRHVGRDTNFYYSFLVLPPEKRRAIVTVWDFCRAVDDAVDEPHASDAPGAGETAALAFWRDEVARCFEGEAPRSPEGHALAGVRASFPLPREPFDDLIDGVAMDIGERRYATFDDLREYCYRVASTVGLICVEIFGYEHPGAREYAIELGLALQLTNILRDIPVDLRRGRLYVPLDEMSRYGCTEGDLRAGAMTASVVALLRHQASRAHEYYSRARSVLPLQDARRLVAAEIMGAIYHAILRKIEARGYDVFSEPVRIPRPRRAWIAATTWLRIAASLSTR
jgi:phytoene synthase